MIDKAYVETVRLLIKAIPETFRTPFFALKGGTALNLFVQEMPRLSVDLDIVYARHDANRDTALKEIGEALDAIRGRLDSLGISSEPLRSRNGDESKLFIRQGRS